MRFAGVARLAGSVARAGVSYEWQSKVLWATLLAGDAFWMGSGAIGGIQACNEDVDENTLKRFETPLHDDGVSCLSPRDAMGTEAVRDYTACALNVAMNVAFTGILVKHYSGGPR